MIAHIDMDSYFASVEQQANPHLRGRPLGVCAYLHKNGCVIAASIEAKKLGVNVGMSMGEARKKCPGMAFVQNDPPKYRAVTTRVFAILHELTDKVEHYSIDEAFLDLTGWYRDEAEAAWALARAKLRIRREVGEWLGCSVGIAPSKFLAKLASDLEKPNGLVVLNETNLDGWLAKLELEDAWGIGKRIRRRLNRLGIFTLLDLKRYPVGNLMRVLGKVGWQWHERLHCRDVDRLDWAGDRLPRSVGHSFCVPRRTSSRVTHRTFQGEELSQSSRVPPFKGSGAQDVRCWTDDENIRILGILLRLTERAGRRMRSYGLLARRMYVAVTVELPDEYAADGLDVGFQRRAVRGGWETSTYFSYTVDFADAADDVFTLTGAAARALENIWDGRSQVTFLAVTLSDLAPWDDQLSLPLDSSVIPAQAVTQRIKTDIRNSVGTGTANGMGSRQRKNDEVGRHRKVSKAVDAIRDRYGEEAIVFANMLGLDKDYAPDRIGFRKTEGVDVPA